MEDDATDRPERASEQDPLMHESRVRFAAMSPDDATDSRPAGNAEAIRASLVEYKELQEEKRVIAQSMYAAIALVAGGVLGLAGAAAQSDKPDLLMLVPFAMLGGAVVVVVLRSHLMRISVYLGMTER